MKEYPVTFAIQEVPENPFDPDGPSVFRGVIRAKALDVAYVVTDVCDTSDEVLAKIAEALKSTTWKISSLARDVEALEHKASNWVTQGLVHQMINDHTARYKHKL